MANSALSKLNLYFRIDASGRVVQNSGILRKKAPRTGRWISYAATQCCDFVAPTLVSLAASIDPTSTTVGGTSTITVIGTYSDSSTQDLSSSATIVSSDPAVATVAGNVATGVSTGSTDLTASYNGVTAPAVTLTVA